MHRTTCAPATPAGRRARPGPGPRRWTVLLLVLAALLGTGAAALLTGGAEMRPAAASPASDPGAETHDPAAAEAGLPGRGRRHRTGVRPARGRHRPRTARRPSRTAAPAPVPAPRGDALRCVVMRC
ncbi:hypothetical protein ACH4M4_30735 [Streptomyces sp. NPDC017254]|uniref:hypothetical protein n=1 Tax=unclassified Streptomyces TaxID=2593676 RepID=UPI0037A5D14F